MKTEKTALAALQAQAGHVNAGIDRQLAQRQKLEGDAGPPLIVDSAVPVLDGDIPSVSAAGHLRAGGTLWHFRARLTRRRADGVTVISGLELKAVYPPDTAITSRLLHEIPLRPLANAVLDHVEENDELDAWADALGVPGARPRAERAQRHAISPTSPPRGAGGTPREFYDALAVEAVNLALARLPVVAELAARREKPEPTIKRWIREARRVGALDPKQGVWNLGQSHPASSR